MKSYRLCSWAEESRLNWPTLDWRTMSANPSPGATAMLAENIANIDWRYLSGNQSAGAAAILAAHPDRIEWAILSSNPHPAIVAILLASPDKIDWTDLSMNSHPDAVALLLASPERINWRQLSGNCCPAAVDAVLANFWKINWFSMVGNPTPRLLKIMGRLEEDLGDRPELIACISRAMLENPCPGAVAHVLARMPIGEPLDEICWKFLSLNAGDEAMTLLAANRDKIYWPNLSLNAHPAAIAMLAERPGLIYWPAASQNPGIFEEVYDYPAMRAAMDVLREDLAVAAGHPRRLARHLELGGAPEDF